MEQYQNQQQGFQQQGYQQPTPQMPKPSSHLAWAIISTLFCCLPFGIVAIVKASQVNSLWFAGCHQEALAASRSARNWVIASVATSLICTIIYIIFAISIFIVSIDAAFTCQME